MTVPSADTNPPRPRGGAAPSTSDRILDSAERLVQLRGFNGFSYADIAGELGITKASLHYHFRTKGELGEALMMRYARRFADALAAIDASTDDAPSKLSAYADLYAGVLEGHRMCLCGMLAAEYQTLPDPMQRAVVTFFDDNQAWLIEVLEHGQRAHTLRFSGPARETAQATLSALEGALLVSRSYGDPELFQATAGRVLAALGPATG
jgi:TetR/AcrR family transcriptional repressor of nem operon